MDGNVAVGYVCPQCSSLGPHTIVAWILEDGFTVGPLLHCMACEWGFAPEEHQRMSDVD